MQGHRARQIKALLAPATIAVFGASSRRSDATGNEVIRYIRKTGYECSLHTVNPAGGVVEGIEAVSTPYSLPPIELAVVALSSAAAADTVEALEATGCLSVIVMSVGMTEADIARLRDVHARGSTYVHGPNCMGLINVSNGLHAWANEDNLAGLPKGNVSIISQSGSGAIFVARSMTGVGFAKIVSTGNEAGATTADYISILAADPDTCAIGAIIESITDGEAFAKSVRQAKAAGKSLVVLKVGRSESGAAAAAAHTGALLSSDAAYVSLFESLGVPLVADYDELAGSLEIMAAHPPQALKSTGIGVLTISGGQAALCADLAHDLGVALPSFSATTRAELARLLPSNPLNNPLDVAAGPEGDRDIFRQVLEVVSRDPEVGIVMPILDLQATLTETEIAFEEGYFGQSLAAASAVPVVIASSSSVSIQPERISQAAGVPLVRGIRNALVGIRSAVAHHAPEDIARPSDLPDAGAVASLKGRLGTGGGAAATEVLGELLTAYRLPFVESATFRDLGEATAWAEGIGFPVVLKVSSPDVQHRSDVGGVVTRIEDAASMGKAWRNITASVASHLPDARLTGMEVQKQLDGQIESFAGFVTDPRLGATMAVGLGGVLIELVKDVARMSAPVNPSVAARKIRSSKLGALMAGHRNLYPQTSLEPLADLVCRLSWMATDLGDAIMEMDLNPVMIEPGSGRVRLVDALVISRAER
ncbi:acetate--CoA ligase family protein [Mesorhizobium intechi]|uniref:acetate--CoA ligase family protein n=1 Tax=Mesorhizobium intechi TaxID=537601 RepID=UPI000CBBAE17|nr:acetate--CoA ligase family protein [Mesorhizobium intechi]TSE13411.1 acetate--CoA ligase family protein [Mesorhizobium intechi]